MTPAIEAVGLVKRFGSSVLAVDGVDLTVQTGTVLGLLGPNGAGKTTVVRMLATLLRPDAGQARVAGFDVVRDADRVRAAIGLAGQYAAVDERLTGAENLRLIARLQLMSARDARRRAAELLEEFDLTDAGNRVVRTYSGGMRRRLDLAAALVHSPPVLFLDEPTTGLDPRSRLQLWSVLEGLVARGTTVLLTTQYLEEADRLADRIAVVDHGRILAEGTAAELKADLSATRLVLDLPDGRTAAAAAQVLTGSPGTGGTPAVQGAAVHLTVTAAPSALAEATARLHEAGLRAIGVTITEPTLDDVFLRLTGAPVSGDAVELSDDALTGSPA